jgi:GNAT superfamily N-acetyltransferase
LSSRNPTAVQAGTPSDFWFFPGMSLVLRPATPADIPLVFQFIRDIADYEKLAHEVVGNEELLAASLFPADRAPTVHCVLAFWEDQPAGFALYFFNFSTFLTRRGLYLEDLFVKPELRGRGIGKSLLLHLAQIANERGCGRMEWTVLDWNQPAIDFYKNLGAVPMSEWTVFRLSGDALKRYAR